MAQPRSARSLVEIQTRARIGGPIDETVQLIEGASADEGDKEESDTGGTEDTGATEEEHKMTGIIVDDGILRNAILAMVERENQKENKVDVDDWSKEGDSKDDDAYTRNCVPLFQTSDQKANRASSAT